MHLDIKPDNILLNSNNFNNATSSLVTLIDFSVSKKYIDENGKHMGKRRLANFEGNLIFSSPEQMEFIGILPLITYCIAPSRRDDLISILYLLIFLKSGTLPWVHISQNP